MLRFVEYMAGEPRAERADASPVTRGLAGRVRALCRGERLFSRGARALVMFSGGQDSLTLLHLLSTGALGDVGPATVSALHVNHHLRGDESLADQALVEARCAELGVPLTVAHEPVDKKSGNVQEVAREARRRAALEAAAAVGATRIAQGHTLDDQVETMLYRMARYGGLAAVRGMRPCEGLLVRPLLGVRRWETEAYCRANGLEFAVDRGNQHPGYARTALRGRVLPAWEEAIPGAAEAAARTARMAAEAEELILGVLEAAVALVELRGAPEGGGEWSAARLLGLPQAVRRAMLRRLLERCPEVDRSRSLVLSLESLAGQAGSGTLALGGGWHACKAYDRFTVLRLDRARVCTQEPVGPIPLSFPGEARWRELVVGAYPAPDGYLAPDPQREAFLDARSLDGPLRVRGAISGDVMWPLGGPGRRSLQDIFVDLRVPAPLRAEVPVVLCGDQVVWLAGLVVSQESRIVRDTERVVRLSVGRQGA